MPFEVGNTYGQGRPRRLDVELSRLREAAMHARGCVETQALAAAMSADDPEMQALLRRRVAEGVARLAEIDAQLDRLAELAEEVSPILSTKGRRRRPRFGPWEMVVSEAAIRLDRLLGPETTAQ